MNFVNMPEPHWAGEYPFTLVLQPEDKPGGRIPPRLGGFRLQDDTNARLFVTASDTAIPLGLDAPSST
ncbi:hypothetical protein [Streptomyces sp. NPDC002057]|uniref:hypothetical protein n=1 Tax=Streptomyces sp. NPDC002057 TaxID=3154664 RepID=UPI003330CCB7